MRLRRLKDCFTPSNINLFCILKTLGILTISVSQYKILNSFTIYYCVKLFQLDFGASVAGTGMLGSDCSYRRIRGEDWQG